MERKFNKQQKLHIRKGDTVKVLSGDDKNKTGKGLEILTSKSRVLVEGINIITKHQKPSAGKPHDGIKKIESGVHISNLILIDPTYGKPTQTSRKLNEKRSLQRHSKEAGYLRK